MDSIQQAIDDADQKLAEQQRVYRRQLIFWAVRWVLGGALVVAFVVKQPHLWWMLPIAGGVAGLTLWMVTNRWKQVRRRHARLVEALRAGGPGMTPPA